MSAIAMALLALGAALADLTLGHATAIGGGQVSFAIALVCAWTVARPLDEAMALAPLTAVIAGLLGPASLGWTVLLLATPVLLAALWRGPGSRPALALVLLLTVLTVALAGLLATASLLIGRLPFPGILSITRATIATGLMTIPLAAVVYWLAMRITWQPASGVIGGRLPR